MEPQKRMKPEVEANDSLGWTFADIAKSISENL